MKKLESIWSVVSAENLRLSALAMLVSIWKGLMLAKAEFFEYVRSLSLTEETIKFIQQLRLSPDGSVAPPVRRISSHVGNSNVRFPSLKNGFVAECESGRPEYYYALHADHNDDVFEFYPQPCTVTLHYPSGLGRAVTAHHTPDFFVLSASCVEFVECKTLDGLEEQAKKQPNRYLKTDAGIWISPPGQAAAQALGLRYRIWTPAEMTPQFTANLVYLHPHYRRGPDAYLAERYLPVVDYVREHQGISIDALSTHVGPDGPALVRWMLVQRHLHCDLQHQLVSESADTFLYTSPDLIRAAKHFGPGAVPWPTALAGKAPGAADQKSVAISHAFTHYGASAFGVANQRWALIHGTPVPTLQPTPRTIRIWKKAMAKALKLYGVSFLGLLPEIAAQGNRGFRYPDAIYALADEVIKERYLVTASLTRASAYRIFVARCAAQFLAPVPSAWWFYQRVHNAATLPEATLLRQGRRAAYPLLANKKGRVGALDVHGDYPLHRVHIDHTLLDIEIVSATGLNLGRPWLTVAFDATTRAVLAIYLTFDEPSVVSLIMVLRDLVLRHGLMPIGLNVDNGPEFHSVWFEVFTALHQIVVFRRPPREARFGSVIENFFGVLTSQFIHSLVGNTQLMRNVRQVTKSILPENLAIWTLPTLYDFLEAYCFQYFNFHVNADVGQAPADAFKALVLKHGIDALQAQKFDEGFLISTMVGVNGETARVQPARGVKIRGDYFYHPDLDRVLGQDIPIRYDPMDAGRVFAQVAGKWVPCLSKFADRVACLSVRQVQCWTEFLRKRHDAAKRANEVPMLRLGQFIEKIKTTTEGELRVQYEQALANREVLARHPSLLPAGTPFVPASAPDAAKGPALVPVVFTPLPAQPFAGSTFPSRA
jgi:putative transposase